MKLTLLAPLIFMIANNPAVSEKYLFYLHGAVVEGQGDQAKNSFGTYRYNDIVSAFEKENFVVMSEVRKSGTDVKQYAGKIKDQIDSLLKKGVRPENITVVGGSKGALIAMLTLCLDIGGTKIAAGLADAAGALLHTVIRPTPTDATAEQVWDAVAATIADALRAADGQVAGVGIASAGLVDRVASRFKPADCAARPPCRAHRSAARRRRRRTGSRSPRRRGRGR